MQVFHKFLGDLEHLTASSSSNDKGEYVHPRLKNLGCVNLVLIREAIAPVVFKNFEQEITDIEIMSGGDPHVRAVPNKFKYPERGRGLQILRAVKAGGHFPQNRTVLKEGQKHSEVFDLNTFVFGDSVQKPDVLPVKAAVNYSDAVSVLPIIKCVGKTEHVRANEAGSLFDEEKKGSSSNLFTRHFVKPATLMIQVLSTRGRLLPPIGLDHLLLCLGVAGTYGGQTSVTGINIRTRFVGVYGDLFEHPSTSPYELVKSLLEEELEVKQNVVGLIDHLHQRLSPFHQVVMDSASVTSYQQGLMERFEKDFKGLEADYQAAHKKIGDFFNAWFGKEEKVKGSKKKGGNKELFDKSE